MSEPHSVQFDRMDNLADELVKANSSIGAALSELDERVNSLREQWSGEAAEAYRTAHDSWGEALSEMNRILQSAHRAATTIAQRHRAAEASVVELWGKS